MGESNPRIKIICKNRDKEYFFAVKDVEAIHKIAFAARNLTSNAGLFLLLENAKANGILNLSNAGLIFDRPSTNKIKMNHIQTMLGDHYIGID